MRKWNGWGDEANSFPASPEARRFLAEVVGQAAPLADADLLSVIARVPPSRLPPHPLVSTDAELRVRHARGQSFPDWLAMRSGDFGVYPDGVAQPASGDEVRALLAYAREHGVVVIPYGGGTSVAGHITPLAGDRPVLTIAMTRISGLLSLDRESQIATFGAGTAGPDLESALRAEGYTLGHFPQSFELSTVGGWVASRSSGQQSLRYGRIEQMFAGGRVETFSGTLDIPTFPASSAGPDLREIMLGSEGRFGLLTEVKVRVTPLAHHESFHAVFLPDWSTAVLAIRELAQAKLPLSMLRLSNAQETRTHLILAGHAFQVGVLEKYLSVRGAGSDKCMLTFGVTGDRQMTRFALREALRRLRSYGAVTTGTLLGKKWAANRFRSPYLRDSLWEQGYAIDTLETAVDWPRVPGTVDRIEAALRSGLSQEGERVLAFTHLSHLYPQGSSIYTTYAFRCAGTYAETLARWKKLKHLASLAIVASGGTISHQHGVGRDHAPYLPSEKGEIGMGVLTTLARHFDPVCQLNPGKLLMDE